MILFDVFSFEDLEKRKLFLFVFKVLFYVILLSLEFSLGLVNSKFDNF